ncbi:Hypothetical protein BFG00_0056 [Corynebacterium pseudotuberculosis]|nr:Hypothetical protein BFG00_0056 [Corynebacterium pseudotuberculosis]
MWAPLSPAQKLPVHLARRMGEQTVETGYGVGAVHHYVKESREAS